MNTIVIERYQPERDCAAVQIISDESHDDFLAESGNAPMKTIETYLKDAQYITKVLRVNGQTVGFINYKAFNHTCLTFYIRRCGLIHLLGIKKQHWRKGYGRKLLQHALADLQQQNVSWVELCVRRTNMKARILYEKEGFLCTIPNAFQRHLSDLMYARYFPINMKALPKGNLMQRHPKISLALITIAGAIGLLYWIKPWTINIPGRAT